MKFRLLILFMLFVGFGPVSVSFGQTVKKTTVTDSATAARLYRNSKHYKDSVAKARLAKTKATQAARLARTDSVKKIRALATDSIAGIRKLRTDSLQIQQKERTEKTVKLKKYKGSKRYADSVAIVKRVRLDSVKRRQKMHSDSLANERRTAIGKEKSIRKREADSLKLIRTRFSDSLKFVRKKRTDSLTKARNAKTKALVVKDKKTEEKKKLALELKFKQKHEEFTNKTMLKKKWSPFRRLTQNSFTHYNYYYNANRKMEEANANMLRGGQKENYDSLIKLFPFDPDRDSSMLAADMDSIIRKVSVGIQIHDPRVKWGNDLYLLMGQAYYYKGKYNDAAATFRYIITTDEEAKMKANSAKGKKNIPTTFADEGKSKFNIFEHKSVHNDAIIWLARTYTQMKMVENGQAVLSLLSTDPNLPDGLSGKVAAGRAFGYLNDNNYTGAADQLKVVIEDPYSPDWLRMRAAFLNGQIMQNEGRHMAAVENYEKALEFFPKLEMDFYARKNIAYNTLLAGKDVGEGIKPLKNVLNDGKYISYHDQVYYVLGQLSARSGKPKDAIGYLTKSTQAPRATKKQKALSFAALGDVLYNSGDYPAAKNAYDSSLKYGGTGAKDAELLAAQQKSKGLAEVAGPFAIIKEQDSLMALAALSKKEQQSAVRKHLRELEKKMQDSINNAAAGEATIADREEAVAESTGAASWYFSNPATMQQGSNDFKRKWGNRPLSDNWRRGGGGGATAPLPGADGISMEETPQEELKTEKGLPTEESLLAKIPNGKDQKELSNRITARAYVNLAKAYFRQLDDYVQAGRTLDTLVARFPEHNQKEEEMYLRYQLAIREGKLDKAAELSKAFVSRFPSSPYAALMKPKAEDSKLASANRGRPVAEYYDETYELIIRHQYADALARIDTAKREYTNPVFRKRFQVAEAMSYAGQGNLNMADTLINGFLAANPADSLTGWANQISAFIKDVRVNGMPSWYKEKPVWETGKPAVAAKSADVPKPVPKGPPKPPRPADVPVMFAYSPAEPHSAMIVLSGLDSRTLPLKKGLIAADSAMGLTDKNITIDMYSPSEIVFMVRTFATAQEASNYLDTVLAGDLFRNYRKEEIKQFVISAPNFKKMFFEKDIELYTYYYNQYYRK